MTRIDGQRLLLEGPVTLEHHLDLRAASVAWLASARPEVDWSAVTAVDSSALSLMLHWQRARPAGAAPLTHRNLPAALLALADLYGVQDLLATGP